MFWEVFRESIALWICNSAERLGRFALFIRFEIKNDIHFVLPVIRSRTGCSFIKPWIIIVLIFIDIDESQIKREVPVYVSGIKDIDEATWCDTWLSPIERWWKLEDRTSVKGLGGDLMRIFVRVIFLFFRLSVKVLQNMWMTFVNKSLCVNNIIVIIERTICYEGTACLYLVDVMYYFFLFCFNFQLLSILI